MSGETIPRAVGFLTLFFYKQFVLKIAFSFGNYLIKFKLSKVYAHLSIILCFMYFLCRQIVKAALE